MIVRLGVNDLETTGLLEPEHRIIECAVVSVDLDTTTFDVSNKTSRVWRIDPARSIDAKARAVHGITESDLIGKPTWDKVAKEIADELGQCDIVAGHNFIEFDAAFLIKEWDRVGCEIPDFEPFCTMLQGRWSTPMGAVPSLKTLCWACGVTYDPALAHAALYDVERCLDCLIFGLKRGVYTLPSLDSAT